MGGTGLTVSVNLVTVCVFLSLSLLCAAAYAGMRRQPSLAWLAASLMCGGLEAYVLGVARGAGAEMVAINLLVPAAYICVGQCVRIITGQDRQYRGLLAVIAALIATALVLFAAGAPFIVHTMPFQLGCAIALGESIFRLYRSGDRGAPSIGLIVLMCGIAGIFLVRIPLLPILFDIASPYVEVKSSALEKGLLSLSALLVPPTVFLLLARIIGAEIATYRIRSERDGLTGLLNRRAFDQTAQAGAPYGGAVIFCDIDRFKQVNDRYGHQTGDGVIRAFAVLLEDTGHQAGRVGGEEFALLLPGATATEAAKVADMIRLAFHHTRCEGISPDKPLSASFGIAEYAPGEEPRNAFVRADAALYRAKEGGRNRVVIFSGANAMAKTTGRRRHAA